MDPVVDDSRTPPAPDITAPVRDNETFVECRACGRVWKATSVPGLLHAYVATCPTCTPVLWPK